MRLKKELSQHRRDFRAVYECEHCGHEQEGYGYDDQYFHEKAIPDMKCKACGKAAPDGAPRTAPDIPPWAVL